jgi:hypothetical protein
VFDSTTPLKAFIERMLLLRTSELSEGRVAKEAKDVRRE